MKRLTILLITAVITTVTFANPIFPGFSATLFEHLNEVNQEWSKHYAPEDFDMICNFQNDKQRIQKHLMLVEQHLRENTPKHLNNKQLENRKQALDLLKAYYQDNVFPENHYHPTRQPYFIDNHGTACAVGQLVIQTGFEQLAQQISKENNYAYIQELKTLYPALLQWADEYGFTLDELAWIQPGYPPVGQDWNAVGNNLGTDGTIYTLKAHGNQMLYMAGDFTTVDGITANSIIGWDGSDWHTFGDGVDGIVHDIAIDDAGRLFIGGEFVVYGNPSIVNVAYWDNGQWRGFNTGNMTGVVYTIDILNEQFYIGGSFALNYPNYTIENLAFTSFDSDNLENQNGDFSVEGEVFDIVVEGNQVYVAGDFSSTAPQSINPIVNQLETNHLAVWGYENSSFNWVQAFDHEAGSSLNTVFVNDSKIYIGANSNENEATAIGFFENGEWTYEYCGKIDSENTTIINGFLNHNGIILTYGNISYVGTFSMVQLRGLAVLENEVNAADGAEFSASVTAAESFRNQIYFAGPFTSVQGQNFPGLVSSPFGDFTSAEEIAIPAPIEVYSAPAQINIQYEALQEDFDLTIYQLNGQVVASEALPLGSAELSISTQTWAKGIYVYQAVSKSGKWYSGKLSVM